MSQEPAQPLTAAQVEEWIRNATVKRLEFHLHAAEPLSSPVRAQAFWEMAELCQDAIEEVRVLSAQLWDESQAVRARSADLLTKSAQLLARYTSHESQLLRIFTGKQRGGTH